MCHLCRRCNKEVKYDKKHQRYPIFCSKECLELYNSEKLQREKDNRKCIICGKPAFYVEKYNRFLKTCNSDECKKECCKLAQKKAVPGRTKFRITKEELEDLYINQNKTRIEIANIIGCSEAKVKKFIMKYGLFKDYSLRVTRTMETKQKKYGNSGFVNHEKAKQTCLEKYGVSSNLLLLNPLTTTKRISNSETEWLDRLNIKLRQYRIDLENKITFVDGYDSETNTIYEFFGDYWHANPIKYKEDFYNARSHKTAKEIWEIDQWHFKQYRSLGYNIKFVWEYDYKQLKLMFSEFNDYLS